MTNKSSEAKTKQLQEKITKSFDHYAISFEVDGRYSPCQWVKEVFQAFIDAGGVLLAEDQTLPVGTFDYKQHERIFREAGFHRTTEIKLEDLEKKYAG